MKLTEKQVNEKTRGKLKSCPLCDCEKDEGHALCFHCVECGYLQCCDYDGFYNKHRA